MAIASVVLGLLLVIVGLIDNAEIPDHGRNVPPAIAAMRGRSSVWPVTNLADVPLVRPLRLCRGGLLGKIIVMDSFAGGT